MDRKAQGAMCLTREITGCEPWPPLSDNFNESSFLCQLFFLIKRFNKNDYIITIQLFLKVIFF